MIVHFLQLFFSFIVVFVITAALLGFDEAAWFGIVLFVVVGGLLYVIGWTVEELTGGDSA